VLQTYTKAETLKPKTAVKSFKKCENSNALDGAEVFVGTKEVEFQELGAMTIVIVVMSSVGSVTSSNFKVQCHFSELSTCEFIKFQM